MSYIARAILRTKNIPALKDQIMWNVEILYPSSLLSETNALSFSYILRIINNSCLKTLPKSTKTHWREGVAAGEGVSQSEGASPTVEEREGKREERREWVWTRWSSTKKPPRGYRVVSVCTGSAIRPWCQRAARDTLPCWHWSSSWGAAWLPASDRTTRSPSCSKGSVLWCATRTPLRTEGSPPHLAYQSALLGQRWLFPPCEEPTTSLQRWATRLWPSTLTRSDIQQTVSYFHVIRCVSISTPSFTLIAVDVQNLFKSMLYWFPFTTRALCNVNTKYPWHKEHDALVHSMSSFYAVRNCRVLDARWEKRMIIMQDSLSSKC